MILKKTDIDTLKDPSHEYWGAVDHPLTLYYEYWLKFDPEFTKLTGNPTVDNIGLFLVTVESSDLNSSVTDRFVMSVENKGPELSDTPSL